MFNFKFNLKEDLIFDLIRNRENSVLPKKIDIWYWGEASLQTKEMLIEGFWQRYWGSTKAELTKGHQVLISFPLVYKVESVQDDPYYIFCPNFSIAIDNSKKITQRFGKGAFSNFIKTRNIAQFLTSNDVNFRTLAAMTVSEQPNFSRKFSTDYFKSHYELKKFFLNNYGFKLKIINHRFTMFYNDTYMAVLDARITLWRKEEIINRFKKVYKHMVSEVKFKRDLRIEVYYSYNGVDFRIRSIKHPKKKFKHIIDLEILNYSFKKTEKEKHQRAVNFIQNYDEILYKKITLLAGYLHADNVRLFLHLKVNKKEKYIVKYVSVLAPRILKYKEHWKEAKYQKRDYLHGIKSSNDLEQFLDNAIKMYKKKPKKIDFRKCIPKPILKPLTRLQRIFKRFCKKN